MANSKRPDEPRDFVRNKRAMFEQLAREKEEKSKAASKQRAQAKAAAKPREKEVPPQAKKEGKRDVTDRQNIVYSTYTISQLIESFPDKAPRIQIPAGLKLRGEVAKRYEKESPRIYSEFIQNLKRAQALEKELGEHQKFEVVQQVSKGKVGESRKKIDASHVQFQSFINLIESVEKYVKELAARKPVEKKGVEVKHVKQPERAPEEKPLPADLNKAIEEQMKRVKKLKESPIEGVNVRLGAGSQLGKAGTVQNPNLRKAEVKLVTLLLDRYNENLDKAIHHATHNSQKWYMTLKEERTAMKHILERIRSLQGMNDTTKFYIQERALEAILNSLEKEKRFGFKSSKNVPGFMKEKDSGMAKYVSAMYEDVKLARQHNADVYGAIDFRKVDEGWKAVVKAVSPKAQEILATKPSTEGKRPRGK